MGKKCTLKHCESLKSNGKLHVFQLHKQSFRIDKWITFLEDNGIKYKENENYYLCEQHFSDHMITINATRKRLKDHAYPSTVSNFRNQISIN